MIFAQLFVLRYGKQARHVIYKNHTIIYTIQGDYVVIERIVTSALIAE